MSTTLQRAAARLSLLLLLLLSLCGGARAAADFSFATLDLQGVGDRDSVPYGLVTAITQDRSGLLWIGTQNGLLRFDGYRFKRWVHRHGDEHSLGGDYVRALQFDASGRLWIATQGDGVSVFDPGSEQFQTYRQANSALPDDRVHALLADADGSVWIGSERGLLRWQARRGLQVVVGLDAVPDPPALAVRSLLRDRQGRLWVGSRAGLWRWSGTQPTVAGGDPRSPPLLPGATVTALFEASDGRLWIGTEVDGAAWLEPDELRLHRLPASTGNDPAHSHPRIAAIAEPHPGQIWLGSYGNGISIVDAADGSLLQQLRHDPAVATSLAFDNVNALWTDASGLLWVGTWGGGLQHAYPGQQAFRAIRASQRDPRGLSHANVRSVLELDDGTIWVGTGGNGIDILDRRRGRTDGLRADPARADALPDAIVSALAQTRDGSVWVGTQQSGLLRRRPGQRGFERFDREQGLPDRLVYRLLAASDGGLWIGTRAGLAHWQPGAARLRNYAEGSGDRLQAAVWDLDLDREQRLWISSEDGLWLLAPGATAPRPIRNEPQRADSLAHNFVNAALFDRDGRLWADTALGLERMAGWDGTRARFDHISSLIGRPGLYLDGNLLLDRRGRIWNQRFVLDPDSLQLDTLTRADGIDFGTSWFGAFAELRDGRYLFGGSQGLVLADPERYRRWNYAPPVVATDAWVGGHRVTLDRLRGGLRLQPGERSFTIEFAALDYSAPERNRYRYRLLGFDADWVVTDAEHRVASYTNLPAGDYVLEIEGSGRNGDVAGQPLRIPLQVVPAFWQTLGFQALALLALGLALAAGYRWRLRSLRARTHRLRELVDQRTAQLRHLALHDQLTGLPLLSVARERLQAAVQRAVQHDDPVALLFLDLDGFKAINDQHGHEAGDLVLQEVGRRLQSLLRGQDVAARIGGDEFIVIVERGGNAELATTLAQRILDRLLQPIAIDGEQVSIGVSIGIALCPQHARNAEALRRAADAAMYQVKRGGKNGYAFAAAIDPGRAAESD